MEDPGSLGGRFVYCLGPVWGLKYPPGSFLRRIRRRRRVGHPSRVCRGWWSTPRRTVGRPDSVTGSSVPPVHDPRWGLGLERLDPWVWGGAMLRRVNFFFVLMNKRVNSKECYNSVHCIKKCICVKTKDLLLPKFVLSDSYWKSDERCKEMKKFVYLS